MGDTSYTKSGGSSGPTTPAAALLNAGAPSTIVALDGSGVGTELSYAATRTAIAATPGATIVDPLTGAGWTETEAASTSRTWTSGEKVTLTASSGATGRVEVDRAAVIPGTAQAWDLCVRIDVTAGDGTSGTGYFLLAAWVDSSNYVYGRLLTDGTMRLVYKIAGSETPGGDVAGPSPGQRTGGDLWVRLHGDAFGRWVLLWGVGSAGALPTAWRRTHAIDVGALAVAVPATAGIDLWVGSAGGTPLSATHTVEVLAIRTTWSGSL